MKLIKIEKDGVGKERKILLKESSSKEELEALGLDIANDEFQKWEDCSLPIMGDDRPDIDNIRLTLSLPGEDYLLIER